MPIIVGGACVPEATYLVPLTVGTLGLALDDVARLGATVYNRLGKVLEIALVRLFFFGVGRC